MDRLTLPIEWKAAGDDSGSLEGYASTFGNVDLGRDVVQKGAFKSTIANIKAAGIPLLADHQASTASVLGTIFDAREDDHGLLIKARFSSAPSAQDVRTKLLEGHLNRMSIGYEATKYAFADQDDKTVRLLQEIKLWEISVVVIPMNPEAVISRVKSAGAEKTYEDRRRQLSLTLRDQYGGDGIDVWLRDFDDEKVWFDVWTEADGSGTYEQAYAIGDDDSVSLDGDRAKVRAVTTYVPDTKADQAESGPNDSPANSGDAKARHAEAESKDSDTPAGDAAKPSWDRWASEAVLAGRDPNQFASSADVAGARERLAITEAALGLTTTNTKGE